MKTYKVRFIETVVTEVEVIADSVSEAKSKTITGDWVMGTDVEVDRFNIEISRVDEAVEQ